MIALRLQCESRAMRTSFLVKYPQALNGRFLKRARNKRMVEVKRGFGKRPLSATRLADVRGCLVCPVPSARRKPGSLNTAHAFCTKSEPVRSSELASELELRYLFLE
jgi:hypothetical protein